MRSIILCIVMITCSVANASVLLPYNIQGKISIKYNGQFAYLYVFPTPFQPPQLLSCIINNGRFRFAGNIQQAEGKYCLARLFIHNQAGFSTNDYPVIMESGTMSYRDFILEKEVDVDVGFSIETSIVKGASLNEVFNHVSEINVLIAVKTESLKKWYGTSIQKSGNNIRVINGINAEYAVAFAELQDIRTSRILKFIGENPTSIFAIEELNAFASLSPTSRQKFQSDWEEIFPVLPGDWLKSPQGKLVVKQMNSIKASLRLRPGSRIPNYIFNDQLDSLSVNNYRGRYFLLYFWTSWCLTCRSEQDDLEFVYNRFNNKGFTILQVSLDAGLDNWKKAIAENGVVWKQGRLKKGWDLAVAKKFEVYGAPSSYLVDPNGKIIARNLPAKELEKTLAEIIN